MLSRRLALFAVALCAAAWPALPADSSLVNLIGPNAQVVMGLDVDQVKGSPFGQYMLSQMKLDAEHLGKFAEASGFDPTRDVHEVLVVADSIERREPLVLVRGAFDPSKIASFAAGVGAQTSSYNGVMMFSGEGKNGSNGAAAFLNGSLMVLGMPDAVKAVIDRQKQGAASAGLMSRVQSLSSRYHAWMLTTGSPAQFAKGVENPNLKGAMNGAMIQGIENVAAGVRFGANVEIGGEATARSPKDAEALVNVAQFFVTMAQGNAGGTPEITNLMNSLQITSQGNMVRFTLTSPSADFEKFFQNGGRRARVKPAVLK